MLMLEHPRNAGVMGKLPWRKKLACVCGVTALVCVKPAGDWGMHQGNATKRTSGVISLFTGPHQTSFSEAGSLTIRLSDGERPVFAPEYAESAPADVMAVPVS